MLKQFFFIAMLLCLGANHAAAQPVNPCDPASVSQFQNDLIAQGFDCLQNAGPFECINDVFEYAFENCPLPIDTTGNNPCTPEAVAQVESDLLAQGFSCLEDAGPFACVDEVINFVLANCPDPNGGSGGNPCDPAIVGQLQAELIAQGFACLEGAGPFNCVNDVFDYAYANCPTPIDTTDYNPCDPVLVGQFQADLIAQGFNCLVGAGPFVCVEDVLDYAFANGPTPIDTTDYNPCDPAQVAQVQSDLIAQGFDCLINAGPFACINDVFDYAYANCVPPIDTSACDPILVAQVQADLIAQGFACLEGAGPFICIDDVVNYAFENCPPPIDTTGGDQCTPEAVQQTIDDLVAQGYACVANAGPFYCVHEVVCYAMEYCPLEVDTTFVEIPQCLLYLPANILTFQQFLQYMVQNCDSAFVATIPACWLTAPTFDTDEAFLQWITENCGLDSLIGGDAGVLANRFFNTQGVTATRQPSGMLDLQVSPNPAGATVTVGLKNGALSRIELYDLDGRRRMMQENVSGSQTTLNLSQLPAGMYLLRVQDGDKGIATRRIVKE